MKTVSALIAVLLALAGAQVHAEGLTLPGKARTAAAPLPFVRAEVRKVEEERKLVILRHEEIPNLAMGAMTMSFEVSDAGMLSGLKAGDHVRFQAAMVDGRIQVTRLERAP